MTQGIFILASAYSTGDYNGKFAYVELDKVLVEEGVRKTPGSSATATTKLESRHARKRY